VARKVKSRNCLIIKTLRPQFGLAPGTDAVFYVIIQSYYNTTNSNDRLRLVNGLGYRILLPVRSCELSCKDRRTRNDRYAAAALNRILGYFRRSPGILRKRIPGRFPFLVYPGSAENSVRELPVLRQNVRARPGENRRAVVPGRTGPGGPRLTAGEYILALLVRRRPARGLRIPSAFPFQLDHGYLRRRVRGDRFFIVRRRPQPMLFGLSHKRCLSAVSFSR
jgi:hypothetical protein